MSQLATGWGVRRSSIAGTQHPNEGPKGPRGHAHLGRTIANRQTAWKRHPDTPAVARPRLGIPATITTKGSLHVIDVGSMSCCKIRNNAAVS